MFVPTHYFDKKGSSIAVPIMVTHGDPHLHPHSKFTDIHRICSSGLTVQTTSEVFNLLHEPIFLDCPSCNTKIQQQERVECGECGFIMCAINGSISFVINGLPGIVMHNINSICWLQIQDGKK